MYRLMSAMSDNIGSDVEAVARTELLRRQVLPNSENYAYQLQWRGHKDHRCAEKIAPKTQTESVWYT